MELGHKSLGKTFHSLSKSMPYLAPPKKEPPIIFAGIYPLAEQSYDQFQKKMFSLLMEDGSVVHKKEFSGLFGNGF